MSEAYQAVRFPVPRGWLGRAPPYIEYQGYARRERCPHHSRFISFLERMSMTTFDAWEAMIRPPEDYLMHFRTKGSKNGVRRYQNPDGSWTEAGLAERRKREGWGDSESRKEKKAQKRVEKAEKALARSERHQARKEAREQRQFERSEQRRKRTLKGLTDEEMKAKLERAKMEAEYRNLTKRTGMIEKGAELVGKYLDYKDKKDQRTIDMNRVKVDMERAKADIIKAKEGTKRTRAEADKAKQERLKTKADVKGGLKLERKKGLIDAKREYKNYTIRGGIAKRINMLLTSGKAKQYESERKAKGDVEAAKIRSDGTRDLKNRQKSQKQTDSKPERDRQNEAYKQEKKRQDANRKAYEKERKRLRKKFGNSSDFGLAPRL